VVKGGVDKKKLIELVNRPELFEQTNFSYVTEDSFYSALLLDVASYQCNEEEAIEIWSLICEHHGHLSRELNRDIDFFVSILDYFTHINQKLDNPVIIEINVLKRNKMLAMKDSLTGLFNRRYLDSAMEKEFKRAKRYQGFFSILLLDLDNFKGINDSKGHLFGDKILRELGKYLLEECREEDTACRYGGEEFCIILPETTSAGAINFAERLRINLHENEFFEKNNVTFSGGIATYPEHASTIIDLFHCADKSLYLAKYAGKDRIINNYKYHRRFARFEKSWSVFYYPLDEEFPKDRNEFITQEVSLGGLRFESSEKMTVDDRLMLHIYPIDNKNESIKIVGIIRRIRNLPNECFEYGTEFFDLKAEQYNRMKKVLPES